MEMYAFLLRPGLAALDNLADKFVAGWLLPSKVLDLNYPTPPLPHLVFAIQSDEGRQLAGKSTAIAKTEETTATMQATRITSTTKVSTESIPSQAM